MILLILYVSINYDTFNSFNSVYDSINSLYGIYDSIIYELLLI